MLWQDDERLSVPNGTHYDVAGTRQLSVTRYESVLYVYNTTQLDHGRYKCLASNELGHDSLYIALDATSQYNSAACSLSCIVL